MTDIESDILSVAAEMFGVKSAEILQATPGKKGRCGEARLALVLLFRDEMRYSWQQIEMILRYRNARSVATQHCAARQKLKDNPGFADLADELRKEIMAAYPGECYVGNT